MNSAIVKSLSRGLHRTLFKLNQKSPEILLVAGIGGIVGSTVLACRATIKANEVVKDMKKELENIEIASTQADEAAYSEEDRVNDLKAVYIQNSIKLAKIYAPAVAVGILSITGIVCSHGILRGRLGEAIAACATISSGFAKYRARVAEAIGEDEELKIYHDVESYKESDVDEYDGIKLAKRRDNRDLVDGYSIYARCFDEGNPLWRDDAKYNLDRLRGIQRYLNEKLERDGYLSLNDAYRELCFEPTSVGQLVGWIYDPNRTDRCGDNRISFGLYDPRRGPALGDFINGHEKSVFLDFNVDGVIVDKIDRIKKW